MVLCVLLALIILVSVKARGVLAGLPVRCSARARRGGRPPTGMIGVTLSYSGDTQRPVEFAAPGGWNSPAKTLCPCNNPLPRVPEHAQRALAPKAARARAQGVTVFRDIIRWFEKQNNWIGWTCFTLLYCLNIAILLPGILFILAAGFVFGRALPADTHLDSFDGMHVHGCAVAGPPLMMFHRCWHGFC